MSRRRLLLGGTCKNPEYTAPTAKSLTYNGEAQELLNAGVTSNGTIQYSSDNNTWSTTIPSGTNATGYTVYWRLVGSRGFCNIESTSINVTINKVTPTVVPPTPVENLVYNGTSQVLIEEGSTDYGLLRYSSNGIIWGGIPGGTSAGTYTVYYRVDGDSNINDVAAQSIVATINKVTPTVVAPTPITNLVYNGNAQALINGGSTNWGTLQYSLDNSTYSTSIPSGTNATAYTIYYRVVGDSNINDVAAQSVSVSISKVTPTVVAPTPKVLTYNGSAQELANAGSTDFGTLQYKVGSDSWSTSIPTRQRGGSYVLSYRVVGDSNINDVAAQTVQCSINEKQVTATVTLSQTTYTYNGSACQPTPTVKDGTTVIDPSEYTVTYSNNVNAGTATVTISDNVGGDYEVIGSATFTINKATGSVSTAPVNTNYTYNGTARAVASAGSGTGTMYYRLGASGSFSTTMPTMTDAGSNTLYYYAAESTNYTQSTTGSITVSVQKANISPTVSISNWTYGGTASNPSVAGNSGSGTVTYYYKLSSASSWSTTKPSDAGSYNIKADIASTTNYNSGTCTNNFTINKANSSLSFAVTNITVEVGETKTNAVTVNTGDGTVTYSSNNTTAVTVNNSGVVTGVNPGNATITANISSTSNYNSASTSYTASCVAIVTAKFNVTDTTNPTNISYKKDAYHDATSGFSSIEVDGVTLPSVVSTYTFNTIGEHTVRYTLKNPTSICESAFTFCYSMTSVNIPNTVTSIGASVFSFCTSLTSVTIPSGVTIINHHTFSYSTSLTSCTMGSGVTNIGDYAFYQCSGLTSIDIPDAVTNIGGAAFGYCSGLTSVTIGSGVTTIGNAAFDSCTGLTSITIPDSVTSIGASVFSRCYGFTTITIPSGVTSIGNGCFNYCSGLTSMTVNATTPPTLGSDVFLNTNNCPIYVPCDSVDTYKAASGWSTYASRIEAIAGSCPPMVTAKFNVTSTTNPTLIGYDGYITGFSEIKIDGVVQPSVVSAYTFSTTGEHTVKYNLRSTSIGDSVFVSCSGMTTCTIGSGVTSIGANVFNGCSSLTSINIPNSVTSIGNSAFTSCYSLTSIVIPNSVTSIGDSTFYQCTSLTSIDIPSGVTSIGYEAFYNCSGLTSCTIGSGVTSISSYAFQNCSSLASIVCNATTAPTIQLTTFRNVKTGGTLTVPSGSSGYDVWMGTSNYYLGYYNWTKVEQ